MVTEQSTAYLDSLGNVSTPLKSAHHLHSNHSIVNRVNPRAIRMTMKMLTKIKTKMRTRATKMKAQVDQMLTSMSKKKNKTKV